MEEENELEEGEAYFLQEEEEEEDDDEEDNSCIDPDSLSYIDVKLQNVLGHFQKDFEGGMSAENLGAKFGGYGSFLPTYQRSPSILSQSSPSKLPNQNSVRSPCNLSFEGTRRNASFASSASVTKNNATSTSLLDNSRKTDMCMSMPNNRESISQHNLFNRPTNSTDLKTLKVRIKVGPNDNLARDNAAIYSGLGLDISPSSSFEESIDGSGGISPESLLDESPKTIIQVMTCFSIPGGFLLSPLPDGLFQLTERDNLLFKKGKTGAVYKGMPKKGTILENILLPTRELNGQVERNGKSCDKKGRSKEKRNPKDEVDIGTILNREIDIETPAGEELVFSALNIHLLSGQTNDVEKSERHIVSTMAKSNLKNYSSRVPNKVSLKSFGMSPVLVNDKQFESTERNMSNVIDNLDNGVAHSRGRCNTKQSVLERRTEEHDANGRADPSYSLQTNGQMKIEKDFDTSHKNTHSSGYKWRNGQIADPLDEFKKIPSQKDTSLEEDREKILHSQDQTCDRKGKVKVGPSTSEPFRELSKDNSSGNSSVAAKEQRKSSRAAVDCVEKKVKVPKGRKESGGSTYGKSCRGITGNGNAEHVENGMNYLDSNVCSVQKVGKPECDKALIQSTQTLKEKSSSRKVEVNLVSGVFLGDSSFTRDAPPPEVTMAPQAAVVIQENWVCCDKCHKWRLLPYGTDPGSLPKEWVCSSLNWLPGLNSCDISEEETTRALHALFMAPVPEISTSNRGIPLSGDTLSGGAHESQNITSNAQNLSFVGNKSTVKDASSLLNHSTGFPFSNSVKKNKQNPIKTPSLNDGDHAAFETVSSIKGTLGSSSKNTDLNSGKQKHKQTDKHKLVCHSDEGDFIEKSRRHSKSKSKREIDQDHVEASKKLRKEGLQYADKNWHSRNDVFGKLTEENFNDDVATKVVASNQPRYKDFSLADDSGCDLKGNSSTSTQKSKGEYVSAMDVDKPGNIELSLKKRKTKEWHENNCKATVAGQDVADHKVIFTRVPCENDQVNAKKAKISKSKVRVLKSGKTDNRKDKIITSKNSVLPASGETLLDGKIHDGQYLSGQRYGLNPCQINELRMSDVDFLKRDMSSVQTSTAANSSSSKVSGSHRNKAHYQEAKGSPVESVSSSPVRIPTTEKPPNKKISARADDMILGTPRRCSDSEVDGHFDRLRKGTNVPVQQQSKENNRARDSSLRGIYDYQENDGPSDGKSDYLMYQGNKYFHRISDKNGYQDLDEVNTMLHTANEFSHKKPDRSSSGLKEKPRGSKSVLDAGKISVSSSYGENKDSYTKKNNISRGHEDNMHSVFSEARKEKCNFEEKDEKYRAKKRDSLSKCSTGRQDSNSNTAIREHPNANDYPALPIQNRVSDSRAPVNGAKLQVAPSYHEEKAQNRSCSEKADQQELPSGLERSLINLPSDDKHETNCHGPVFNESSSKVNSVVGTNDTLVMVKPSRQPDTHNGLLYCNLRHATPNGPDTSSPMRKDGHFSVSAVLKEARDLKHTANRLKTEGLESESTNLYFEAALKFLHAASLMEPSDSIKHGDAAQMYSETAKLCQFVAHEYERCKEMVGAALAYKCVEVAYLKAAYCKNPTACKDRHEVQAVMQMLPPGESPSSSASDVDNLNNNLGTLGKAIIAKGVSSPQIAANHAVAARLHPQVLRLLHYTNDLNFAFEATRKSQIAIAADTMSEKKLLDGQSSVREALDFNFHNVEGLMRLVRIAMRNIIH